MDIGQEMKDKDVLTRAVIISDFCRSTLAC